MARRRLTIGIGPIVAGFAQAQPGDELTERVLDAASELLAAYGLSRWSIDDVADRAGVGRTSVYRKFDGRDDLVHAVLARELRATFTAMDAAAARARRLDDKVVEAALVALEALPGSLVEQLLRSDPATFLPFLTTGAGPLLTMARQLMVSQASALGLQVDAAQAAEVAEVAARLGLSFVLTRDTVLPVDDPDAMRAALRRLLRPLLAPLAGPGRAAACGDPNEDSLIARGRLMAQGSVANEYRSSTW